MRCSRRLANWPALADERGHHLEHARLVRVAVGGDVEHHIAVRPGHGRVAAVVAPAASVGDRPGRPSPSRPRPGCGGSGRGASRAALTGPWRRGRRRSSSGRRPSCGPAMGSRDRGGRSCGVAWSGRAGRRTRSRAGPWGRPWGTPGRRGPVAGREPLAGAAERLGHDRGEAGAVRGDERRGRGLARAAAGHEGERQSGGEASHGGWGRSDQPGFCHRRRSRMSDAAIVSTRPSFA